MITFSGRAPDGHPYLLLGLSPDEVEAITRHDTALVELADLGLPPLRLVISGQAMTEEVITQVKKYGNHAS